MGDGDKSWESLDCKRNRVHLKREKEREREREREN